MANQALIDKLNDVTADGIVFYQKLRNYHWHVKGPQFFTLHAKFEDLYTAFADHVDEAAERIVALGGVAVPTLADAMKRAAVKEDPAQPDAPTMVATIVEDLHIIAGRVKAAIAAAEEADDRPTANTLDEIADAIEAVRWMIAAYQG